MRARSSVKIIVTCVFCFPLLLASCVPLSPPETGSITDVSPMEGTVGTELTISGTSLGDVAGQVLVGTSEAEVIRWSPTEIVARVAGPLTVGELDVTVHPRFQIPLKLSAFSVREPEIESSFRPQFLSGGETMTLAGQFLGNEAGTVRLENRQGQSVDAKVSAWSMDSVTFQVPTGLEGLQTLLVVNDVGESRQWSWCTFEACPAGGVPEPVPNDEGVLENTNNTSDAPTAIQFEGDLWVFGAGLNDNDIRANRYINGSSTLSDAPDPTGNTYTQVQPLVVDGVLWLFATMTDGQIKYTRYNTATKSWDGMHTLPGATTPNKYPVGAAYNNADPYHRIEVFYYNNSHILRTYSDDYGLHWSSPATVVSYATFGPGALFVENAAYWDSSQNETITLPFATLVAYDIGNGIELAYVQDGRRVYATNKTVNATLGGFHPCLADLGPDYIALLSGDLSCQPVVRKISKETGKIGSSWHPIPYTNYSACFNPTGAAGVTKIEDPNSEGGYRYDTYFYMFWGKNNDKLFSKDFWLREQIEYLGYYTEPEPPVPADFATLKKETFYLWPVIGVVDAPPFVLNGHSIEEWDCIPAAECTRVDFGAQVSGAVEFGMAASIGPYTETGDHSPVKMAVGAQISASVNTEKSKTVGRHDTMFRSEEGNVMVFYLTPQFQTHTYLWYNHDSGPTDKNLHVVELIDVGMTSLIFDPRENPCVGCDYMPEPYWENLPTHGFETDQERLESYALVPSEPASLQSDGDWNSGGEGEIDWSQDTTKTIDAGMDIEFKVGKSGMIGGGVEGSFNMHFSLNLGVLTDAHTYLVCPDATHDYTDIDHFHVKGYWLEPNASGCWVPLNRQGMGDEPWFITYYVGSIDTHVPQP